MNDKVKKVLASLGDLKKVNDIDVLVALSNTARYVRNCLDEVWAVYEFNGSRYVVPVKSKRFKHWLGNLLYNTKGKAVNKATINAVVNLCETRGLYGSDLEEIFIRFGNDDNKNYYLDLGNSVIKINKEGWKKLNPLDKQIPLFYRPNGFKSLPDPLNGGTIEDLKPFLNLNSDSELRLIASWIVSAMNPKIATPILILQGEQGSAKSTTARIIRSIIDPNGADLKQASKEIRDLFISAKYNAVIVWDNLSGLSGQYSDALCRICTGAGFSARELYTDSDEITIKVKRPIILNGIDSIANRGDLQDRSIILNLPVIDGIDRRTEKDLWDEFVRVHPLLLGAILDAFVVALKNHDQVQLNELPRMADFARFSVAAAPSFGYSGEVFLNDYRLNQMDGINNTIISDATSIALLNIMKATDKWSGTATELLSTIAANLPESHSSDIPNTRTLKDKFNRLAPLFRKIDIILKYQGHTAKGSLYIIENIHP